VAGIGNRRAPFSQVFPTVPMGLGGPAANVREKASAVQTSGISPLPPFFPLVMTVPTERLLEKSRGGALLPLFLLRFSLSRSSSLPTHQRSKNPTELAVFDVSPSFFLLFNRSSLRRRGDDIGNVGSINRGAGSSLPPSAILSAIGRRGVR